MYRYYQTSETSQWQHIRDENNVLEKAVKSGAKKLTILAVSEIVDDDTDKASLSYKGPLYFDIDYKGDIALAIRSANLLVERLHKLDVPNEAIQVVASGSKGLHIMVPASVFSAGRATKNLPLIYKEMALSLHVLGLDFQVYSQGRGVSWRILNQQRHDDRYPVPLTVEELQQLTPEQYQTLVTAPRPQQVFDLTGVRAPGLEALFERAKKRVRAKPVATSSIADSELIVIKDVTPACIEELVAYKVKESVAFNHAALQLGIYAARAGIEEEVWDSLCSRMAENGHSSQYNTKMARYEHAVGVVRYCLSDQSKKFACNANRGLIKNRVCEGCALYQQETSDDDAGLELGIIEKEDGYYLKGDKSDKLIATFILNPINVYMEEPQGGGEPIRIATVMDLMRGGEKITTIRFDEGSWNSKASFVKEIDGIGNLVFVGSDTDVQRIKHTVFAEGRDMGEVTQVQATGMHIQRAGRRTVRVYVEPNYSINQLRVTGTHTMGRKVPAPPHLRDALLPEQGEEQLTKALNALMRVNSPDIVAQVMGWFCACHLKMHFMQRYSQFPILSLWGNAGSGKTKTATLFAWLSGVDYTLEDAPMNLSSITTWATLSYCSSSTTVPRLLDEYNKSKMDRKMYNLCGEVMKAAWNGQVIGRGMPSRGRTGGPDVLETPMSAPLLVMSEQAPEMPALQQRMIQVMVTRQGRFGCDAAFEYASQHREEFLKVSKAMMGQALRTEVSWVEAQMDAYKDRLSKELDERPRYSYQCALVGLDFFALTCKQVGLDMTGTVEDLKTALIDMLNEQGAEIAKSKSRTEVDAVMEDIGTMITLSDDGSEKWLERHKHFATDDGFMYLDLPIVHALYKRYCKQQRGLVVIESAAQFAKLLEQETYFITNKEIKKDMVRGRPVVKVSLSKMEEKGHLISMFEG